MPGQSPVKISNLFEGRSGIMSSQRQSVTDLAGVIADGGAEPTAGIALEALRREFEELGLSTYEARILLAILRLGSGSPGQLARFADVPRTSAYQILEE